MTRIGVGIGAVCLAVANYVFAYGQVSQDAAAKRSASGASTAAQNDTGKKDGAANETTVNAAASALCLLPKSTPPGWSDTWRKPFFMMSYLHSYAGLPRCCCQSP